VNRIDAPCQAIVRHLRNLGDLRFVESDIGRHHADGGVGARRHLHQTAFADLAHRVQEARTIRLARAGDNFSAAGIRDIADGVYSDDGPHDDSCIANVNARGAKAGFHRLLGSEHFSNRRSRTRANIALFYFPGACALAGLVTGFGGRPDFRIAHSQVEQDRGGNDGNDVRPHAKPLPVLFQISDHARSRIQPKRAAARE